MGLGAIGVALRYGVVIWWANSSFPWGTLIVNAAGSLLIGYIYSQTLQNGASTWLPLIMFGFLGALTTYSSFSLDTLRLFEQGAIGLAALNVLANNLLGIGLCYLGYKVGNVLAMP